MYSAALDSFSFLPVSDTKLHIIFEKNKYLLIILYFAHHLSFFLHFFRDTPASIFTLSVFYNYTVQPDFCQFYTNIELLKFLLFITT